MHDPPGPFETTLLSWEMVSVREKMCCSEEGEAKRAGGLLAFSNLQSCLKKKRESVWNMASVALDPRNAEGTSECSPSTSALLLHCTTIKKADGFMLRLPHSPPLSSSWEPHSRLHRLWIIKFHGVARESRTGQIWIIDQDWADVHSQRVRVEP